MNRCLTVAGEEGGCCGAIHGGIPHGEAYPPGGDSHDIVDDQYPWLGGGGGVLKLWLGGGGYQKPAP
jgi:hypothetical protein